MADFLQSMFFNFFFFQVNSVIERFPKGFQSKSLAPMKIQPVIDQLITVEVVTLCCFVVVYPLSKIYVARWPTFGLREMNCTICWASIASSSICLLIRFRALKFIRSEWRNEGSWRHAARCWEKKMESRGGSAAVTCYQQGRILRQQSNGWNPRLSSLSLIIDDIKK